jgi:N-acetylmuramic acid 6-phosphate etherase
MKEFAKSARTFFGIEGGATRSSGILIDEKGKILKRVEGGPCNLRLVKDADVLKLWKQWKKEISPFTFPETVGAFLAGCRTSSDKSHIRRLLKTIWPTSHSMVGNDTVSAMAAALGNEDGIIVICGTGSIVRARRGQINVQTGGWGHIGGDRGSGYWMGRELLRTLFQNHDLTGKNGALTQSVLAFLGLNKLEELVQWSLDATKDEIASLTKILFRHRAHPSARLIIEQAVKLLSADVVLAAKKVGFLRIRKPFPIVINPALAKYQPYFRRLLTNEIQKRIPLACVYLSETEGALGGALLVRSISGGSLLNHSRLSLTVKKSATEKPTATEDRGLAEALTEQRNPRTLNLDRQSIPELIRAMLKEEQHTIPAIRTQEKHMAIAIRWIVESFKRGGRLFYVGAGTSGRLGVLDAAECPPTFGCDPETVQGIMAGGRRALYQSVEAAEDNLNYGRQAIWDRGVRKKDIVVGIAASGSTPFVLGALEAAHSIGAKTIFLTFNPNSKFQIRSPHFLKIAIPTGPEVITGSTRLKAGTATKLVLNMFTTISMIRLGKVRSNLMIDLDPSCEKLHDRAARIYSALKKVPYEKARQVLDKNGWNLKGLL